jgi:hypothetical protein
MSEALKKTNNENVDSLAEAIHDLEEVIVLQRTAVDVISSGPDKLNLACTMTSGVLRKLAQLKDKLEKSRVRERAK